MEEDDWGQGLVDARKPNIARVYDFYLGGRHNFPADQELAQRIVAAYPWVPEIMRQNRAFLREAVTHMVAAPGISQFLDLGAGLPTEGAVNEVAQAIQPSARVVYVDVDPVAVLHTRQILARNPLCAAVQADFSDIGAILSHRAVMSLLDLRRPIGVLSLSTLHFVPDDSQVSRMVHAIYHHVAPGSVYAVSHGSADAKPEQAHQAEQLYRASGTPFRLRTRQQLQALIAPFQVMPPGMVPVDQWHPGEIFAPPQASHAYACLAIKKPDPQTRP